MKRLLLILAGVIGLIVAGGTVASVPLGSPRNMAAPTRVAPSHHARQVLSHAAPTGVPRTPLRAHQRRVQQAAQGTRVSGSAARRPVATARPTKTPMSPVARVSALAALPAAAPNRYLLVDPPGAAPGAAVAVQGGGFAAGAAVHLGVQAPGQALLPQTEVTTERDGSFRATITMPATQTAPAAALVARDAQGHSAAATLLLRAVQPLAGLKPKVVTPGQSVALSVANFRPGETVRVYAERLAGQPILTASAGADGSGSWPLTVPYGPGGVNQVVVVGDQGRTPVVAQYLLLNLYPHASVSNYAPQPGSRVTLHGAGFGPNEPVELRLDRPDGPVLATARANAGGGLRRLGPYRVPFGLSGVHSFIVRGADSHASDAVGVTVEPFFTNVQPSTYAAGPGTTVTFYGAGFAPHEIVRVYLGRTAQSAGTEVAALRTTALGRTIASSGSYTLPATVHGSKMSFALVGDISGAVAWTSLHYMARSGPGALIGSSGTYHAPARQHPPVTSKLGPRSPLLAATPPRVVAGGRVSLWGAGFAPHTMVHLVLASHDNPQGWALRTVRSAADGTLKGTVTIPPWVAHADVVHAYSDARGAAPAAAAALAVWPALPAPVPWTYSGTAGTRYGLAANGFTPGEQVTLYLDSIATPPLATTSSRGGHITFSGVRVPVATAGAHTFVVKGASGDIAAVPFTELPFTPFLLLNPYSSLPERPVSVGGQGFAPGETVHLWVSAGGSTIEGGATTDDRGALDGSRFVGGGTADDRGALHATAVFTIPTNARGRLQVLAVGDTSARPLRATLNVQPFEPSLWMSGYAGHPGATVAFTGTGFARHDIVRVYLGDATTPAATFQAHNGAFGGAGTVRIPFDTRAGMLPLTVRGALSNTKVTLRYMVLAFTPGAGFEVRHRGGFTVLRLGAGGFAAHEVVRLYLGTRAEGTPLRLLHADAAGNLPLLPVLAVRGTPRKNLAYTLVGVQSEAQATALYTPPRAGKRQHRPAP